jgi:hypothetical protein
MAVVNLCSLAPGLVAVEVTLSALGRGVSLLLSELFCPASCGVSSRASAPEGKIVTWLILPVVICLSQRLSHACLSISNIYRETANGSLNQLSFI